MEGNDMFNACDVSIEDLIQALDNSFPGNEKIRIIETIHDDHTVIFNWKNKGYIASSYVHCGSLRPEPRVAVGRIHAERYPDDTSHLMLEQVINRCISSR